MVTKRGIPNMHIELAKFQKQDENKAIQFAIKKMVFVN